VFPAKSYGVPAYDGLFELKQPSGKAFEARKRGDEWYNWVETKDGYGIYQNKGTENWEYYVPADKTAVEKDSKSIQKKYLGKTQDTTPRDIVGEVDPASHGISKGLRPPRASEARPKTFDSRPDVSPKKTPLPHGEKESSFWQGDSERVFLGKTVNGSQEGVGKSQKSTAVSGTKHLLVIGVDYDDTPATYTAEQIQPLVFGASSSVSDYYGEVSYSAVTISPATESKGTSNDGFIGWLRLSGNHPNPEQYTDGDQKSKVRHQIAKDAILAADTYIDYASFDTDGDGEVESTELSIMIIVAGYEASTSSSSPSVWGHKGRVSVSVDGKAIYEYAMFGEKHGDHLATIGVMVHELGHLMFSLPDLYDTDTSNGGFYGIGVFCLMASGGWGAVSGAYGGSSPTHLCAWSKEYLSWSTVNTITSSQSVSFPKADGNSASIFRMNTSDSNQYFLIENRQFGGYDLGFQGATGASGHGGLVIYHIDKLKTDLWPNTSNEVNADENDKGVDVEEANEGSLGYSMLDTKEYAAHTDMFFFSGNNTSFTDTTTPNSRLKNGRSTYISLTGISAYGDTMTASVTMPPTAKTGSVTNMTSSSATLNGTVNAFGEATTAWFEYGTTIGSYSNTTSTQTVSGTGDTTVSIDISGLSEKTTYYYRIVAKNSVGTVYGTESTFMLITVTPKISGGSVHTIALKSDGTVWTWGSDRYGQLGDGTTTDRSIPVQGNNLSGITTVASGLFHNLALKSDGTIITWGSNWQGQLGDGTILDRTTPVQINGLSNITNIAGGYHHSLALKLDGTVWAWGDNESGELGNGTTTDETTPVQISGITNVTSITCRWDHNLALKSDGTVWAWGRNSSGQLGDGSTTNRTSPVQVKGISNVTAIASGNAYSLALKSDGTIWAWGYNAHGQLGDGTTSDRTTPVQVSGISGIVTIAGGGQHNLARKSDGTVWAWGYNGYSQLGDGTTSDRITPVQVSGLSSIVAVACGEYHSLALKSDGTVWAWGDNEIGQLGDGTTINRNTPVQVDINLGETPDTFAPTGSININSGSDYTNSATVTLNLSASDSTGVTGYYLSTSSTKPSSDDTGWTSISSTTSYNTDVSYTLSSGDGNKTVYVWYKDEAGNVSDNASDSITLDTTVPIVTIASPTSNATYTTTNSTISLRGSALDSTSGINSVKWSNSNSGSGMASGTTNWSISSINLSKGDNIITVIATDNAGNTGKDTVTVTYTGQTSTPTPTSTTTPIPAVSPTLPPLCEAETITVSPFSLTLKRKKSVAVTVTVPPGEYGCSFTVTATINAAGNKRISISPASAMTDENGEAVFTITAKKKTGAARFIFNAGSLKKSITVRVRN